MKVNFTKSYNDFFNVTNNCLEKQVLNVYIQNITSVKSDCKKLTTDLFTAQGN